MVASEAGLGRTAAFEISEGQYDRVLETVAALRANPGDQAVVDNLIHLVLDLTDTGLGYFFVYPLELAGVGTLRRKGVEVAIGTAGRVLPSVVRSTISSMSESQLVKIADFMERMVGVSPRDR
jgi:hypothetical protein